MSKSKYERIGVDKIAKGFIYGAKTGEEAESLCEDLYNSLGMGAVIDLEIQPEEDEEGFPIFFEIYAEDLGELDNLLAAYNEQEPSDE